MRSKRTSSKKFSALGKMTLYSRPSDHFTGVIASATYTVLATDLNSQKEAIGSVRKVSPAGVQGETGATSSLRVLSLSTQIPLKVHPQLLMDAFLVRPCDFRHGMK